MFADSIAENIAAYDLPDGFSLPDWRLPFDPTPYFDAVPEDATAKGMFLQALFEEAACKDVRLGEEGERFYPFRNYPLRRCMELTVEAAEKPYPDLTLRDGIRRVAWLSYATFAQSMIGRVVFGVAGQEVGRILQLASKGASIASTVGKMEVVDLQKDSAVLRVSDIYIFAECFNVGMAESVLRACNREGIVAQQMFSPTEGDFYVRWG